MAITDLALFKKHVRADDFADDDEYLAHILDTAEMAVVTATNRPLEELLEMGDGNLYFFYAVKHHIFQEFVLDDAIHTLGDSIVLRVTTIRIIIKIFQPLHEFRRTCRLPS